MTIDALDIMTTQTDLPLPDPEPQFLYDGGEVFRRLPDDRVELCSGDADPHPIATEVETGKAARHNSPQDRAPLQLDIFPDQLTLRRIDPNLNMRRFYRLTVLRDLFGSAVLCKEWGRIGSAGKIQNLRFNDEATAVDALALTAKQKQKRGYEV